MAAAGDQHWIVPPPGSLPPSPEPQGAAWTGWDSSGWDEQVRSERWDYDAHPNQSGWNASAEGHAAALMLSAAYTHAHLTGERAPRVDMRWHRPDQDELRPMGHGPRGDVAPANVHGALDVVIAGRQTLSDLEKRLLHAWLDRVWILHSRAPLRLVPALRQLGLFDDGEIEQLDAAMRGNPLTDFRIVMLALDPRETPVYGRTHSGPGISRLFRRFNSVFAGQAAGSEHAQWSEDDGGESGSSAEEQHEHAPFQLTALQRQAQRIRHAVRRIRRVIKAADNAEELAKLQEARMKDEIDRNNLGGVLFKILLRGLRRGPSD